MDRLKIDWNREDIATPRAMIPTGMLDMSRNETVEKSRCLGVGLKPIRRAETGRRPSRALQSRKKALLDAVADSGAGSQIFSRPHQSAMNSAADWVTRRTESRSTRSLKP